MIFFSYLVFVFQKKKTEIAYHITLSIRTYMPGQIVDTNQASQNRCH